MLNDLSANTAKGKMGGLTTKIGALETLSDQLFPFLNGLPKSVPFPPRPGLHFGFSILCIGRSLPALFFTFHLYFFFDLVFLVFVGFRGVFRSLPVSSR